MFEINDNHDIEDFVGAIEGLAAMYMMMGGVLLERGRLEMALLLKNIQFGRINIGHEALRAAVLKHVTTLGMENDGIVFSTIEHLDEEKLRVSEAVEKGSNQIPPPPQRPYGSAWLANSGS